MLAGLGWIGWRRDVVHSDLTELTLDDQIEALAHAIKVLTTELARLVQLRLAAGSPAPRETKAAR